MDPAASLKSTRLAGHLRPPLGSWDCSTHARRGHAKVKHFTRAEFGTGGKAHRYPRHNAGPIRKCNIVAFAGKEPLDIKVHKLADREFLAVSDVNEMYKAVLLEARQLVQQLLEQQAKLEGVTRGLMEDKKWMQSRYEEAMSVSRARYTELQVAIVRGDELQSSLNSTEKELERVRKELGRAVLIAAEQIEEQLRNTWETENAANFQALQDELTSTKKQLSEMESSAVESKKAIDLRIKETVQDAVRGVESETKAAIGLSTASAKVAREAAGKSSSAATTILKQQQEALAVVKSIKQRAYDAEQAAERSHEESLALQEEVKNLREALTKSQAKLADETIRATKIEEEASKRVAKIEKEAASRVNAVETAYEILRKAEREKVENLEKEAGRLRTENQHLASEVEELREEMSLAEAAVAQAQAKMTAMESALNRKLELLEKIREAEEGDAEMMEAAFAAAAREYRAEELHNQLAKEIDTAKGAMDQSMKQFNLRLEALNRAALSATAERDHWKRRARKAEDQEKVALMKFKDLVAEVNGFRDGRVNITLAASEKRRLFAMGPRSEEGHGGGETSVTINSGWVPAPDSRGSD